MPVNLARKRKPTDKEENTRRYKVYSGTSKQCFLMQVLSPLQISGACLGQWFSALIAYQDQGWESYF